VERLFRYAYLADQLGNRDTQFLCFKMAAICSTPNLFFSSSLQNPPSPVLDFAENYLLFWTKKSRYHQK
jgi:hypothetical protein